MKPTAISIALLAAVACGLLVFHGIHSTSLVPIGPMVIGVLALVWALLWFRWITPDWIKIAADAYAERLLEASDELAGGEGPHAHTERVAAIRPKAAGTE